MKFEKQISPKSCIKAILFFSILLLILYNQGKTCLSAHPFDNSDKKTQISFEDKLAFYLNQKSKDFLSDMANKEKLLLQMIKNISKEIKARGKRVVINDETAYENIYGEADKLIAEYSEELENILRIIDEIRQLEKVVEQTQDLNAWEKLATLRDQMIGLLESREIYKKGIHTQSRVSHMFKDYNSEVDSALSLYKRLNKLERQAKARGDLKWLEEIESQKQKINLLLGALKTTSTDTLADKYFEETKLFVNVLQELDDLQSKAIEENSEVSIEIEGLKRSLLQRVDKRLLKLLGYDSYYEVEGPTVSELFKEWKANQVAKYNVRFTHYKIMKKTLLLNASTQEKSRMLERDLMDAFSNYIDDNYDLAELQFNLILEDYGEYFNSLEAVLFYRAESFYGRHLYEEAIKEYERIANEYPDSPYFGDSLFRLMLINEKLGNTTDFYKYFTMLKSNINKVESICYNQCNYLAGYVYLKDSKFDLAESVLSNVSKDSKYYLSARYLLGIVYVNENKYPEAIEIFNDLANRENYPWTDPQTTFIRNNALLKLGYIYYELGEFEKALSNFSNVSPGFSDYDKSLLGIAWTNFKQGNYDQTIENVKILFRDYLASNYTYEALILAAHCKRILNQRDSALRDLRYVANARGILVLSNQYNAERKKILDQLTELDRIEEEVLERRDKALYKVISQIRDQLQNMLLQLHHRGTTGSLVLDDLQEERQAILQKIEELDQIITQAHAMGKKNIVNDAYYQRERLIKVLDVYQADRSVHNINYFLDYPLATKEGGLNYRKKILSNMWQEIEFERQRIQDDLRQIQNLQRKGNHAELDLEVKLDLEILENDLKNLKYRSSQFRALLVDTPVQDINTDFDRWADFSGFGLSDITFKNIEEKDAKIAELALNIDVINQILQERRKGLEQKLTKFDEEVKRIEEELQKEKIEMEKLEKEKYFKELYFDTHEREVEETESHEEP